MNVGQIMACLKHFPKDMEVVLSVGKYERSVNAMTKVKAKSVAQQSQTKTFELTFPENSDVEILHLNSVEPK